MYIIDFTLLKKYANLVFTEIQLVFVLHLYANEMPLRLCVVKNVIRERSKEQSLRLCKHCTTVLVLSTFY